MFYFWFDNIGLCLIEQQVCRKPNLTEFRVREIKGSKTVNLFTIN